MSLSLLTYAHATVQAVLCDPANLKILREASEEWGTRAPCNSAYKLQVLCSKTEKSKPAIRWTLEQIHDQCKSGQMEPGEFSCRQLKDGHGSNKGLIDLYMVKMQMQKQFLNIEIDKRFKSEHRQRVKTIFGSFAEYRKYNPYPNSSMVASVDHTWKADYSESEKLTMRMFESMIYGNEYDAALKFAARLKKSSQEILTTGTCIPEVVAEIDVARAKEDHVVQEELDQTGATTPSGTNQQKKSVVTTGPQKDLTDGHSKWKSFAVIRIGETCKLINDTCDSESALAATIGLTEFAKVKGDGFGNILTLLGSDLTGESVTYPFTRQPPFRKAQIERLLKAVLHARRGVAPRGQNRINTGDIVVFFDGGKRGTIDVVTKTLLANSNGRLSTALTAEGLNKTSCNIVLDEECLKERRCLRRGLNTLHQLQCATAYYNLDTQIPELQRTHYSGTNCGDVLGPVRLLFLISNSHSHNEIVFDLTCLASPLSVCLLSHCLRI